MPSQPFWTQPRGAGLNYADRLLAAQRGATVAPATDWLFHQDWWLTIVSRGTYREAIVMHEGAVAARMPYVVERRGGFTFCDMPPFTRTLGPQLVGPAGDGRRGGHAGRVLNALLAQLPAVHVFRQVFHPDIADALAFQTRDYRLGLQYTYRLDAARGRTALWAGLRDKTRNVVRRAQERYVVASEADPVRFLRFYDDNLRRQGRRNTEAFELFPALHAACVARGRGVLRAAHEAGGAPVAMAFFAWDSQVMYYLLSTRIEGADNGAVSLLLWHGMVEAAERGLHFDLDGVSSPGRAQFLSGFGGRLTPRLVVHKVAPSYALLRAAKSCLTGRRSSNHYD